MVIRVLRKTYNILSLCQVYSACPIVRQSYIHGDSLRDNLVAVIVADPKVLSQIADKAGCSFNDKSPSALAAAMEDPQIKKATLDSMTAHAKKSGLKGWVLLARGLLPDDFR